MSKLESSWEKEMLKKLNHQMMNIDLPIVRDLIFYCQYLPSNPETFE